MAETIYQGYVINKQPYQVFDEIVVFLTDDGQRISCLSRGSRKITSKNARHLFIGSYVEFQIFQSRHQDKLSRLKKATTIKPID
jgi:recombinational DNA repair protein (RecF pathway)